MRACSCVTVACATAGPPHTRRNSACTWECGLARVACPQADEAVEQRALLLQRAVERHRLGAAGLLVVGALPAPIPRPTGLPSLAVAQELGHLLGFEQSGDADEVVLLVAAGLGERAELGAVVHDPVERRVRPDRLPRAEPRLLRGALLAVRGFEQAVVESVVVALAAAPVEGVVALELELRREVHERRNVRQEHRRGLASATRAHEAADRLREEERRRGARGVDADGEAWHVDALGHHPHGDHPPARVARELLDARARLLLVGEHHRDGLAADALEDLGVGAGDGLVGRDHEPAGVGDAVPHLGEPPVGRLQHGRDPLPGRLERGAPRRRGDVLRVVLAEPGLHLVAGLGAPPHVPGVDHEQHRAHDAVGEGAPVAVVVVGAREAHALRVGLVVHERDRRGVGPERGAGEREPPGRRLERLADRVAPRERVAAVVHLVEDHEGAARDRELAVQGGPHRRPAHRSRPRRGSGGRTGRGRCGTPGRAGCRRGPRHPPTGA